MLTVLKWFTNENPEKCKEAPLISRTMCKVALISSEYQALVASNNAVLPRDNEWWWCQIVQETFGKREKSKPGNISGVFVVDPIRPVDRRILKLISGMYTSRVDEGVLIIRPVMNLELPWIMPKQTRDLLRNKYKATAVITDLSPPDYAEVLQQASNARLQKNPPEIGDEDEDEDEDYISANSKED